MADSKKLVMTNRRWFLQRAGALAVACSAPAVAFPAGSAGEQKFRAAIIGHTGQGNYGHEHDTVFNLRENVTVVAVADPDEAGREKAAARCGALRQYADYRRMLEREKPDLVSIAPRWTDQHHAMARAALESGAHVYIEKPFTQTLAEADDLLALAGQKGLRIAVAHQMRLAPNVIFLKRLLDQGRIGELLEIRSHGKQDRRAGGEDLIVLGVHIFDLMRFFAGDPYWCAADILMDGRPVTLADAHPATEGIGPVIGNNIAAQFGFRGGIRSTFVSHGANAEIAGPWGMELVGAKGRVRVLLDIVPRVLVCAASPWTRDGRREEWKPLENDPLFAAPENERTVAYANARVIDDWLRAIREQREPACSGYAGMKALEMAHAVFAAGLARGRVDLPLRRRAHPLRAG